jgi:periplasmic copper chaperone A
MNRTLILGLLSVFLLGSAAKGQPGDHDARPAGIVIEHAEIVLGANESHPPRAFVSIWNGTSSSIDIVSIASKSLGPASLRATVNAGGVSRIRTVTGAMVIPPHSELVMKPDGVHVLFNQPTPSVSDLGSVDIRVDLADGTTVGANAKVLPDGSPVTDHHHGEGDGSGSD